MTKKFLRILLILVIASSAVVTIIAQVHNPWTAAVFMCGLVFRAFFQSNVWSPIFGYDSAQSWFSRKWAARKRPKYDI